MLTRRAFAALACLLPALPALAADGSDAVISAIYSQVSASNGDSGGQFIWLEPTDRRKYFSSRTVKLWRAADAATPDGDQGPIDFDPVTNSQDPQVKAFDVTIEKQDTGRATVVVHISDGPGPADAGRRSSQTPQRLNSLVMVA